MRSGPHLEIVLDQPEVLVRGSFDEATATVLSGRLIVHIQEPLRLRSLKLSLTGRVDTFLNQSLVSPAQARDEHREFLAHHWSFLEPQKHPVAWGRTRTFPFEVLVPGDNPETIHTTLGKVRYQLQATLERTAFHANLQVTQDVCVKRGPKPGAPWALALMESIEANGCWEQQLNYRISVPTRSLKDGELFHTRFELEPLAKGLKLMSVGILIKEYTRYYSNMGSPLHRCARIVARNENYISPAGICSTMARRADQCMDLVDSTSVQIPLVVPQAFTGVMYDALTDLIEVRHRIKFLIKLRDTSHLIHSVFIAVPVSIMPVTARDDSYLLPRYEVAIQNPGTVIMRSDTLPPAYDSVSPRHAPPEFVAPGEDVDGFPGALRRSQSQFYLASPDSSPRLRPLGSADVSQLPGASSSTIAAPESLEQPAFTDEPSPTSPLEIAKHHNSLASAIVEDEDGSRRNSKMSDKMRAIFHSRSSSASSIAQHTRSRSSSNLHPMTPPPPLRPHGSPGEPGRSSSAIPHPTIPLPRTPPEALL
ncbi:hypothetical protein GGF46_004928 [Coemansia sp. RSA 552]|nr:hypothetical protein GGF46_004928 [Coemansia sp. RSA 552]